MLIEPIFYLYPRYFAVDVIMTVLSPICILDQRPVFRMVKGANWHPDFRGAFILKDQRCTAARAEPPASVRSRPIIGWFSLSEFKIGP
jgi:hypothetical protein